MTGARGREALEDVGAESQRQPRLAVLIPVFNDQEGLQKSLASLASEQSKFHVFVVDDGSDPPIRIQPGLPYEVRLIRQEPNQGITAALNAGLAQIITGGYEYVARLDAGDLSLPGRFATQLAFLDGHPEHAAIGTATTYADMKKGIRFDFHPPREHSDLVRFYRYRSGIVHPSAMIRMQALLACGLYRDQFLGSEDYDLFLRLAKKHKLANLGSVFVIKEIDAKSITSKRLRIVVSRIRLLTWHFEPSSVHSYLGIIVNTVLLLAPRPLVLRWRQLISQWRERIRPAS
jgi:glycosyltransferase involved in cell wall biosynthesis